MAQSRYQRQNTRDRYTDHGDTDRDEAPKNSVDEAETEMRGHVHQAETAIAAQGGIDPNRLREQAAPADPGPGVAGNTPPPEGVPEPPPVIDKVTVVKQARTYLDDAVTVANWHLTPADSNEIDQLLSQYFDDGTTVPEDLADMVATEKGMSPVWESGKATPMTITATRTPNQPPQ